MNWIKNASLLFIVFLICYSLLIIGDFLLSRVISSNFIIAEQIENQRMIEEDEPIKEELVNNGFESTYYPDMFDLSPQLVERMEKMKIAPIGGKPLTKPIFVTKDSEWPNIILIDLVYVTLIRSGKCQ